MQGYPGFFFFSSRRRHTRFDCDWSSDVCSSDLEPPSRMEAAAAFVLTFVPGPDLRYLDDKKMGKAYLTRAGQWKDIPGMEAGGIDVRSEERRVGKEGRSGGSLYRGERECEDEW